MSLLPGHRLGKYEVLARIGAGGMGAVYRARDIQLQRIVALKLLSAEGPDTLDRLLHEARAAAGLNHPHICTVHEVGESDGVAFIAMEVVDGDPLDRVIARGRLPGDRVCRLGRQIADALEHAHAHGVIHRDLKAANIVVTPDGRAKILDFGIAERQVGGRADIRTSNAAVPDSRIAGTLAYIAPEVLRGSAPCIQSDLWALGVVLYEMSAGRSPFATGGVSDVIAAILRDPPVPLPSGTLPGLARVIARCLAKEPGERPARAGEVALALEIAETSRVEEATPSTAPAARRRSLLKIALVAITAAVVSLAVYALLPTNIRLTNPVRVTTGDGVEEYADWSPDNLTLAYAAEPSGSLHRAGLNWDIWVTQPGGGDPVNHTPDSPASDLFPSWSPDRKQIAFWSARGGGGCYVMPALGGAARKVLDTGSLDPNPPQWSRDSSTLACVVSLSAETVELHFVELATGEVRRKMPLPGRRRRNFLRFSRDSALGAIVESSAGLSSDVSSLWTFETNGRSKHQITDEMSRVISPSWSADGRSLFYIAPSGAAMDLWQRHLDSRGAPIGPPIALTAGLGLRSATLSPDGTKLAYSQGRRIANVWRVPILDGREATWNDAKQITSEQNYIEYTDVSRDGTRLAISSDRAGTFDLWVLSSEGRDMQQLTSDPSHEWCPRWSPNGSMLAFFAYRSGNRDIYTMPSQGGAWTQVTTNTQTDMNPSWSPDGKELVYLGVPPYAGGVYVSPATGGTPRVVVSDKMNPNSNWSPTNRQVIVFNSQDDKLWTVDPDDGKPARLLLEHPAYSPRWDPSGKRMFFSAPGPEQRLYSIAADGTGLRVVASFTGRRGTLGPNGLSTDGRSLYFTWEEDPGDLWTMDVQRVR